MRWDRLQSIVSALSRLDESNEDDADAVHHALKVIDMVSGEGRGGGEGGGKEERSLQLLEIKGDIVEEDVISSSLFQWVLKRSCQRGVFDANKVSPLHPSHPSLLFSFSNMHLNFSL